MPAFLSETVKFILAPKYWGRHNVSDGYWCSEQNIYRAFHYMDRQGRIFTAEECRAELADYKENNLRYRELNQYPQGVALAARKGQAWWVWAQFWLARIWYSLQRRVRGVHA
jgi:hypothetical protein